MKPHESLLFDLDGTLIDSRDDLADSVNLTLRDLNLRQIESANVYEFIGEGVFNLVNRSIAASIGETPEIEFANHSVEVFRKNYAANLVNKTRLYDGVAGTLAELCEYKKAVVTNKPKDFSVTILEKLGILHHFQVVSGGDSFPERKPHAMPLLETAKMLGATPENCIMIGDSRVDIQAAKNAGMRSIGCTFGFRGREELIAAGADSLIGEFCEISKIVHR